MSEQEAELELIRRAAGGEPVAQERFLLRYRGTLLRYLQRRIPLSLRRHIEPQDVFQDVCFEVFRRTGTSIPTEPGMAVRWLLRIARNRVIDHVRAHGSAKRGGGQLTALDAGESLDGNSVVKLLEQLAVYERTPSQSALHHELLAQLERCLQRLPDDYRIAIRHRYIEGLSVEATAARLNRTGGAISMLCNRGLKALRVELRSFSRYI